MTITESTPQVPVRLDFDGLLPAVTPRSQVPPGLARAGRALLMTTDPRTLATTYWKSWKERDFAALRSTLADDVTFRGTPAPPQAPAHP